MRSSSLLTLGFVRGFRGDSIGALEAYEEAARLAPESIASVFGVFRNALSLGRAREVARYGEILENMIDESSKLAFIEDIRDLPAAAVDAVTPDGKKLMLSYSSRSAALMEIVHEVSRR